MPHFIRDRREKLGIQHKITLKFQQKLRKGSTAGEIPSSSGPAAIPAEHTDILLLLVTLSSFFPMEKKKTFLWKNGGGIVPPRGYHGGSWCQILLFPYPKGKKREEKNPFLPIDFTPVPEYALQNLECIKNWKRWEANESRNFKLCSTGSKFYPSKISFPIRKLV